MERQRSADQKDDLQNRPYRHVVREGSDDDSEAESAGSDRENRPLKKEPFPFPPPRKPEGAPRGGRRTCANCHHFKEAWLPGRGAEQQHQCEASSCLSFATCPTKYLEGTEFYPFYFELILTSVHRSS